MLHTPSYTALNRCAQEGERWSGGYTNQPNPLSSRRALPPLPSTPCGIAHTTSASCGPKFRFCSGLLSVLGPNSMPP